MGEKRAADTAGTPRDPMDGETIVVQHCPVSVSQTRHRPSKLDVTKRFPSALNATAQIRRECASRERTQFPLRTSHKRTTPSSAPVMTRLP